MSERSNGAPNVLIIDDEAGILDSLRILLKNEGFVPHVALGGKAGLEQIEALSPDIVLSDVRMPTVSGLQVLSAARQRDPNTPVILMTAQATLQSAMQAVNEGAFYYIQKPFRNDELIAILRRAAEHRKLRVENKSLKQAIKRAERNGVARPVGVSKSWLEVLRLVETVAPTDSTVLIQGETGTGKELVARALHNLGARRERTFVKLNCAAIPMGLVESELFGHEKGAFTGAIAQKIGRFELANGGTLFLDEIGDVPLELQSKLLRILQEQEFERLGSTRTIRVDVRLIAATNRDLHQMVADREFRSDLYYRLNVFPIDVPPLRERIEDIQTLVRHFVSKYARRMKKTIESIPSHSMEALSRYAWPGNIRELENFIERAVILSPGPILQIPLAELKQSEQASPPAHSMSLTAAEAAHIQRVLKETNGVIGGPSGAAARLGMKRTTLHAKIKKLGITRPA